VKAVLIRGVLATKEIQGDFIKYIKNITPKYQTNVHFLQYVALNGRLNMLRKTAGKRGLAGDYWDSTNLTSKKNCAGTPKTKTKSSTFFIQ